MFLNLVASKSHKRSYPQLNCGQCRLECTVYSNKQVTCARGNRFFFFAARSDGNFFNSSKIDKLYRMKKFYFSARLDTLVVELWRHSGNDVVGRSWWRHTPHPTCVFKKDKSNHRVILNCGSIFRCFNLNSSCSAVACRAFSVLVLMLIAQRWTTLKASQTQCEFAKKKLCQTSLKAVGFCFCFRFPLRFVRSLPFFPLSLVRSIATPKTLELGSVSKKNHNRIKSEKKFYVFLRLLLLIFPQMTSNNMASAWTCFKQQNLNVYNLPGYILICCSNCVYRVYHLVYPLTCRVLLGTV